MEKEQIRSFGRLHWNCGVDEHQNPEMNMRLDEGAAKECMKNPEQAFLRLYSWSPWAVSLGAHQRMDNIDINRCAELGYTIVRRPTGGRAIFHANELTYSIAVALNSPTFTHHDVYRLMHRYLLVSLQHCGFSHLDFEKAQPKFSDLYAKELSSALCFSSSARYEVLWSGKKVIGSAQKLYQQGDKTVVLQHGSVLLGPGHEFLAELLAGITSEQREGIKRRLMERSITLEQICGQKVEFLQIAESIIQVFSEQQI